jgi:serine/threonine-protein kinase
MHKERWQRADAVLECALELDPEHREQYVATACGGDQELEQQVLRLLAADARAQSFLEEPLARVMPDAVGEPGTLAEASGLFGPYRVVRLLGRGGMGEVYLAERDDDQYQRQVALKLLPSHAQSPELQARFLRERQVLAHLEHPNIARLYDGGTTPEGRPYLVLELVDGVPIDRYCDQHRLSVEQRLQLFLRVCSAVEYAHRNFLVHRDIKPANILVTADGTPKLLDFGIVKLLTDSGLDPMQPTGGPFRPMTPLYASPEQIQNQATTTASDTYSLGVLLYLLLTGRTPYELKDRAPGTLERAILDQQTVLPSSRLAGEEQAAAAEAAAANDDAANATDDEATAEATASSSRPRGLASICAARSTNPARLRHQLRGDLDAILLHALRKDPERRYGSARELADDVRRHLDAQPVQVRRPTLGYRFGRFVQRNRWPVSAAALVAVLLLSFALVSLAQSRRIAAQKTIADRQRVKAEQVSGFLLELFGEADPYSGSGSDTTVREVLEQGASKLADFEGQPEMKAAAMYTIGRVYRGLGLYDEATEMTVGALELRQQLADGLDGDVAESQIELATLMMLKGEIEGAEPLLREAVKTSRLLYGEQDWRYAEAINELGAYLHDLTRLDEAEPLLRQSLAIARATFGERSREVAGVTGNLAMVVHGRGDRVQARELYERVIELDRENLPPDHPDLGTSLNNLAALLHDMGEWEEAERLYKESIAIRRKALGPTHLRVAFPHANLAHLYYTMGRLDDSEREYRELLRVFEPTLGADHPLVAGFYTSLSRILLDRGLPEESLPVAEHALKILKAKWPEDNWHVLSAEVVIAGCWTLMGRAEEAEEPLLRGYQLTGEQIGDHEPRAQYALRWLVRHYELRGLDDKAAEYRIRILPSG